MPQVTLYKQDASEAGKATLKDEVFAAKVSEATLHHSVITYLGNQRHGTHATKTRAEVSGGGKKPWKQKHTGRARQGSIRSPQWKGGGTVWGPQPRDYRSEMTQAQRRLALRSALSAKQAEGGLVLVEAFEFAAPKTKAVVDALKKFKLSSAKVLVISDKLTEATKQSLRNLPKVEYTTAGSLNPYQILWAEKVIVTSAAAKKIEEVLA